MLDYVAEDLGNVRIEDVDLVFLRKDQGGTHYLGRAHFEECLSPIYPLLRKSLNPSICVDVGANYGYTGLLMCRAFPASKLFLVEPIPWLKAFIEHNFEANAQQFEAYYQAICSDLSEGKRSSFGVNDRSSQDSRVIPNPGWTIVETDVVTLDGILAAASAEDRVYIKIDTQGWEQRVFTGGERFLSGHSKWFVKAEFAPMWLESQGTLPESLLRYLLERYCVFEFPGRLAWNTADLRHALGRPLTLGDESAFVKYVRRLNRDNTGWVDLFIMPKGDRRGYAIGAAKHPADGISV